MDKGQKMVPKMISNPPNVSNNSEFLNQPFKRQFHSFQTNGISNQQQHHQHLPISSQFFHPHGGGGIQQDGLQSHLPLAIGFGQIPSYQFPFPSSTSQQNSIQNPQFHYQNVHPQLTQQQKMQQHQQLFNYSVNIPLESTQQFQGAIPFWNSEQQYSHQQSLRFPHVLQEPNPYPQEEERVDPSRVLLVIVFELRELEMTNDDLYILFSQYGLVNKVLIFKKSIDQTQAFVEMASVETAIASKLALNKMKVKLFPDMQFRHFKFKVHFSPNTELNLCNYKTEGKDYREHGLIKTQGFITKSEGQQTPSCSRLSNDKEPNKNIKNSNFNLQDQTKEYHDFQKATSFLHNRQYQAVISDGNNEYDEGSVEEDNEDNFHENDNLQFVFEVFSETADKTGFEKEKQLSVHKENHSIRRNTAKSNKNITDKYFNRINLGIQETDGGRSNYENDLSEKSRSRQSLSPIRLNSVWGTSEQLNGENLAAIVQSKLESCESLNQIQEQFSSQSLHNLSEHENSQQIQSQQQQPLQQQQQQQQQQSSPLSYVVKLQQQQLSQQQSQSASSSSIPVSLQQLQRNPTLDSFQDRNKSTCSTLSPCSFPLPNSQSSYAISNKLEYLHLSSAAESSLSPIPKQPSLQQPSCLHLAPTPASNFLDNNQTPSNSNNSSANNEEISMMQGISSLSLSEEPSSLGATNENSLTQESPVIYIKNASIDELRPENIYNIFRNFGYVHSILFMKENSTVLIQYEEANQAKMAINQLNNVFFLGSEPLRISFAKRKAISIPPNLLNNNESPSQSSFMQQQPQAYPRSQHAFNNSNQILNMATSQRSSDYFLNKNKDPRSKVVSQSKKNSFYNPASRTVYITNIPIQLVQNKQDFIELFSYYGSVTKNSISISDMRVTALIEFDSLQTALKSICFLHNSQHYGKLIQIFFTRTTLNY